MGKYKVSLGDEMDKRLAELVEQSGIGAATWLAMWAVERLTGGSPESLIGALRSRFDPCGRPPIQDQMCPGSTQGSIGPAQAPGAPLSGTPGALRVREDLSPSSASSLPPLDLPAPSSADSPPSVAVDQLAVQVSRIIRAGHRDARGPNVPPAALELLLLAAIHGRPPHRERYQTAVLIGVAEHFTQEWAGTRFAKGLNPDRLYGTDLAVNAGQLDADYSSRVGESGKPRTQPPGPATIPAGYFERDGEMIYRDAGGNERQDGGPVSEEEQAELARAARVAANLGGGE